MKKITMLLLLLCLTFATTVIAQELVLDPNQYVNTQILGDTLADGSRAHDVYKLERSQFYAFDGRMDITFRCEIIGPDNGGMIHDKAAGHPPVVVNTPDPTTGAARDFVQILAGGELVLKNFIMSGLVSTGNYSGDMMRSVGGNLFEAENMVFCDWNERVFRSYTEGIDVSVKDCVFMNGGSGDFGVFDGMSIRFNVQGNSYTLENNTLINTGRCICNAGPFLKMKTTILHNSFINCPKTAHEMRHNEFISANNYWYNWEFVGFGPNQIKNNDIYQMNFTTFNDYLPISEKLDSVSCYFGQNGFFIEEAINEWFAARTAEDSIHQSGYWEIAAVDSFVLNDDNYKIGTNYEGFDPVFTVPATKTDELVAFIDAYWQDPQPALAPNYDPLPRVVEFPDGGAPVCNWPLAFDLTYANETWKTGGSDGLPLGDLNWYPEAKATYLANKAQIIAALKDSMVNAKAIYRPPARTPFIRPTTPVSELVLDPNQYVNTQILGDTLADGSRAHTVYKLERSQFYAFDGRMDITFRCEIIGPDNGGMIHDKAAGHPPVVVNTPDPTTGAARDFVQILTGGELVLKNFIMSGLVSTGNYSGDMMRSVGGKLFEAENMVFCDWNERVFRVYTEGIDVSVKDCVFMNGGSGDFGVFDGMSIRFNVQGDSYTLENNTLINTGRCICNAGPFLKMKTTILHNSFINCPKTAHEMRHNEFISANNYWYNWEFVGFGPNQIKNNDIYQMNFTTFNDYLPISDKLDSVSCYFGQNGFFIEEAINEWFAARTAEDSIHQSGYWEIAAVDSFVLNDDNYKIGTNYEGFDPVFTVPATKTDELVAFIDAYWQDPQPALAPNYDPLPRVVEFPDGGAPVCNWPLAFDLSYANETWKTGGSDGLPLGDLNWYPEAKATYLANKAQIIAALKDSMLNAKKIYKPPARTPFITPGMIAVDNDKVATPVEFSLAQNYPNPFNPSTTINYRILKADHVSLDIFNVLGQKVRTLVDKTQMAGSHSVKWDGCDDAGNILADGVYFYRLKADARTSTKKMVLMK